jgi:hypothetical protein
MGRHFSIINHVDHNPTSSTIVEWGKFSTRLRVSAGRKHFWGHYSHLQLQNTKPVAKKTQSQSPKKTQTAPTEQKK